MSSPSSWVFRGEAIEPASWEGDPPSHQPVSSLGSLASSLAPGSSTRHSWAANGLAGPRRLLGDLGGRKSRHNEEIFWSTLLRGFVSEGFEYHVLLLYVGLFAKFHPFFPTLFQKVNVLWVLNHFLVSPNFPHGSGVPYLCLIISLANSLHKTCCCILLSGLPPSNPPFTSSSLTFSHGRPSNWWRIPRSTRPRDNTSELF